MVHAEEIGEYYRVPADMRDLNYGAYVEEGEARLSNAEDYTSENTTRLDVEGMKDLLLQLDFMRTVLDGGPIEAGV